jgi:nicotinate-nucleotide adenylyltransferase
MKIALFGGSFNPPHLAHELGCLYVLERCEVDEVWLVPVFRHAFDKAVAPFADRFEMCRLATARIAGCRVSRVEEEIGGESRTLRTVRHLRATRPGDALALVLGADLIEERKKWMGWDELERTCEIIVLGRVGHPGPAAVLPDISSTTIRERLARGEDVSDLVSRPVLAYLREKGLYA